MKLNNLKKTTGKKSKRRGRGYGSGKGGHTVGFGQKGQSSRSGFKKLRGWIRETKIKSIPKLRGIGKRSAKRGYFKNKINKEIVNLDKLNENYKNGDYVSVRTLVKKKIIKNSDTEVKVLGKGKITRKLYIQDIKVSDSARKKIERAGGKVS